MRKALKIAGITVLVIAVIMAAVPYVFKGKIKEMIIKEANRNLNVTLNFEKLSISLFRQFPKVYMGLDGLTLVNRAPFDGDTLARIKTLAVTVDLSDLLGPGGYNIDKIVIDKPRVWLSVLEDGAVNWDIQKAGESPSPDGSAEEGSPFKLTLKKLQVFDGLVVYDDREYHTYVVLQGLNHSLSGDLTADRTRLNTLTSVNDLYFEYEKVPYINHYQAELDARIDADLVNSMYTLEKNSLRINGLILNFEGSMGILEDGYSFLLTYRVEKNDFRNFLSLVPAIYMKDFQSVETGGKLELGGYIKGVYSGETLPSFLINLVVSDGWFKYPDLPGNVTAVNVKARIENPGGTADNTVVDVDDFRFQVLENPFQLKLHIDHPLSDPYVEMDANGVIDLTAIRQVYPLEEGEELKGKVTADIMLKGKTSAIENQRYNDFIAMGSLLFDSITYHQPTLVHAVKVGHAQMNFSPSYVDLVGLDARIGRSDLQAQGKLENYLPYLMDDGTLKGNMMFSSGLFDLDEILESYSSDSSLTTSEDTSMSAFVVPADLDLSLTTAIDKVIYRNMEIEKVNGRVEIRNQSVILDDLKMNLLNGQAVMNGSYETTDAVHPVLGYSLRLDGIDIPASFSYLPMVEKLVPIARRITGNLSGSISLNTMLGDNLVPLWNTISGKGNISTSPLEVGNVNTLNNLADNLKMDNLRQIQLGKVALSFNIMDGVMNVKPFDFNAGKIPMNLSGFTSVSQEIGYTLNMKVPRSLMGEQANQVIDGLLQGASKYGVDYKPGEYVNLEALIDGTISDPKIKLNLAGMGDDLKSTVVNEVKEQVGKVVEDTKNQAKQEASKILEEADKQAEAIMETARKQVDDIMAAAQKLADETRKQASVQADKLVSEADKKGPLAVIGAKKAADELNKEAERKAGQIMDEARKQSDQILAKARQEADRVRKEAQATVDRQ